jgi:predicted nucleic acid-binding protein
MFAVSNTTPLRYLVAIAHERLLEMLFDRVLIPEAVYAELTDARTPEQVRQLILSPPQWLQIAQAPSIEQGQFPATLHAGEREAILLAEKIRPDLLLIDEYYGRLVGLERKLPVSGTLGVIERADTVGILPDLPSTIQKLKASGFYIADSLERQIVNRHRMRRGC